MGESFEQALERAEADAEAALKTAASATAALRRLRAAARSGHARDLPRTLEAAENAVAALREQVANLRDGWRFDVRGHLAEGGFAAELRAAAAAAGVQVYEHEERLYSYPTLIRVAAEDLAVEIDRKRERRLRPSVLAAHLKALQEQPPRFRPEAFLEALHAAYRRLAPEAAGGVVPLIQVHELLTLLPGAARDYTRQEFARDIYLLDGSGVAVTRDGSEVSFPAATATRGSRTLTVVGRRGEQKIYYGIAFRRTEERA